ncbi:hypothetical protein [Adhaeribacter radiodurans]|nr:hypothetical protein [Adhaeribacter radiodurans]
MKEINYQRLKPKLALFWAAALLITLSSVTTSHSREQELMPLNGSISRTETVKDSLDTKTGLVLAPGFAIISTTCVRCHSPKLITEKRATREGWLATIRWMQQTQGLWDLGKDEPVILDYLAKNYAPKNEGRRPLLKTPEWYKLNN